MSTENTKGILSLMGQKLDEDLQRIYECLELLHQKVDRIEEKIGLIAEPVSEEDPDSYEITVPNYDSKAAWTSTVLFKEEEDDSEE